MSLFSPDRQRIAEFFDSVEPVMNAYKHSIFSYIAMRSGSDFSILFGRILLRAQDLPKQDATFTSQNIRCGCHKLSELELSPKAFVEQLLSGSLSLPDGALVFPLTDRENYGVALTPFHAEGRTLQRRLSVLRIMASPLPSRLGRD